MVIPARSRIRCGVSRAIYAFISERLRRFKERRFAIAVF
jgi:hypothetical protein